MHLPLIKFWPPRAPWKGVCGGAKIFGSALLQRSAQCLRLSERFFIFVCVTFVAFVRQRCRHVRTSRVDSYITIRIKPLHFSALIGTILPSSPRTEPIDALHKPSPLCDGSSGNLIVVCQTTHACRTRQKLASWGSPCECGVSNFPIK